MLDAYELQEVLGEGALGVVHAARTIPDGDRVAVKILRPERATDAVARTRFLREAHVASQIRSRHLVPIIEAGETAGTIYLVMPVYERSLARAGPLELGTVVDLAAQIARGLDALHERSILHRDVKPSNVLLDGNGTAALSDFGLARLTDSTRVTDTGVLLGTPHYLAPELVAGDEATKASDLYAYGCVLYELVTGRPPYAEATRPAEVGFAHLVEDVPDARAHRPDVPADMSLALTSALAKDPRERPTSATAMARMLFLAHRPALA